MNLNFKRLRDALGRMYYSAETRTHRFNIRNAGGGYWEVEVWTLRAVGEIDPVFIADRQVASLMGVSYADAKREAQGWADTRA